VKPSNGSGQEQLLYRGDRSATVSDWSRDGRYLLVDVAPAGGGQTKTDVWVVPVSGNEKPRPLIATPFNEFGASFSPDGKWVLYDSEESGQTEMYVSAFPGPGAKYQVSTNGAAGGTWFKEGREILYGALDSRTILSVEVKSGPGGLEFGSPRTLFKIPPATGAAITRDGERFLLAALPTEAAAPKIALVTNWTSGLTK
jgi:Tol biopolymer transport system component